MTLRKGYSRRSTNGSQLSFVQCEELRRARAVRCILTRGVDDTDEECLRSPDLLKGIFDMGFSKPSKIQERALPLLLRDP